MADGTNTQCSKRTEDWNMLPWKDVQKNVFRLQRRTTKPQARTIPSASTTYNGYCYASFDFAQDRLWSARCLAVRRVTQDNAYASHPLASAHRGLTG